MPRIFNRLLTFKVSGEIYDTETKPEDIIKNYDWNMTISSDDSIFISATHHDRRGRITNAVRLPNIQKTRKPDSEYFLIWLETKMKTTFGLIVGLGILVSGMSQVEAGGYGNRYARRIGVNRPSAVCYTKDRVSYYNKSYYAPRYSWKSAYSKPRGYFGYRYYRTGK